MFAMLPDKLASFTGLLSMLFDTYGGELQPYRMSSWTQVILCKRLPRGPTGKLNKGLLRQESLQGCAACASHAP